MPPRVNTRYQYASAFQDANERWYLQVPRPFRFTNEVDNVAYTVKTGDNLMVIAYRFYKDFPGAPQLWRAIAEFNDIIDATLPLVEGRVLVIPSLRWVQNVFLAPPEDFRNAIIDIGRSS